MSLSLYVTSLNSGSNGNCYYAANENEAILIDAGISCREIEKRMKRLHLNITKLKAVFISHEHTDHTRGISTLHKKYNIPVYATQMTLLHSGLNLGENRVVPFKAHEPVQVGDLTITAFPKVHDACDPFSFIVASNETKVGVFTDIGVVCEHVTNYFKQCHAVFLEANYDDTMLQEGPYPYHLKQRIRGGKGPLSNDEALDLFINFRSAYLSHLFLSHLSKNNNCPLLVEQLFKKHAGDTQVIVASRYVETGLYHVTSVAPVKQQKVFRPWQQLAFSFE